MKRLLPVTVTFAALSMLTSEGAISLDFSSPSAALSNISSSTGSTDPLLWGIVVDRDGSGFGDFEINDGVNINDGAELSPSFFLFIGGDTVLIPFGDGGAGSIDVSRQITVPSELGINLSSDVNETPTGDNFALIWFDTGLGEGTALQSGDKYGLLTNSGFQLPRDGSDQTPYYFFGGPDAPRLADIPVIPEPSILLTGSLSLLLVGRRRRNR